MSELSNLFAELGEAAKKDKKKQEALKKQTAALAETLGVDVEVAFPPPPEPEPEPEIEPEPEPVVEEVVVPTIYAKAKKSAANTAVQLDDFASLMSALAVTAQETKDKIEEVAEEYNIEIEETTPEPVAENVPVLAEVQEVSNLIQDSASALSQLDRAALSVLGTQARKDEQRIEISGLIQDSVNTLAEIADGSPNVPVREIDQLQARVEQLQRQFGELNAIGWGQRGMDYGSGEVRLEMLDDIDRTTAKTDGYYLQYQSSTNKWIGSVSTTGGWDPSGYEYTGDKTLETIENEVGAVNGLEIEEDTWTVMPCTGAVGATPGSEDNNLPTSFSNRIWDRSSNRFSFAEIPTDGVVLFRVNVDVYPETNNALLTGRIRFVAVNDGTEHVLNEDGDRIVLEDDSGNITGDFFQSYSFFQTVAAQEMANGAGALHERTFIFPVYVGNTNAQRGFGQFELNCSCDFTLNDSSVLAVLN